MEGMIEEEVGQGAPGNPLGTCQVVDIRIEFSVAVYLLMYLKCHHAASSRWKTSDVRKRRTQSDFFLPYFSFAPIASFSPGRHQDWCLGSQGSYFTPSTMKRGEHTCTGRSPMLPECRNFLECRKLPLTSTRWVFP